MTEVFDPPMHRERRSGGRGRHEGSAGRRLRSRIQEIACASGVEVWLVEDHALPLVALSFGFKGGASADPVGLGGLAAMLAQMLREGAGDLDGGAFDRALGDCAVDLGFAADHDNLRGELRTLSRHAGRAFDLLAQALNAPLFRAEAMERVRGRMRSALRFQQNDPSAIAARTFFEHAFEDHPYARDPQGTLSTIEALGHADLHALYRKTIVRRGLRIAVVGAIDAATVAAEIDRVFGGLPDGEAWTDAGQRSVRGVGARHVIDLDLPQSTIVFGRQGVPRTDPDHIGALVVNHCLGGGDFSSRLFKEVRQRRGLCYSIQTENADLYRGAMFVGSTSVKNERVREAIDVIGQVIATLRVDGIGEDELANAKTFLIGSYALRFDTSTNIANLLLTMQLNGLGSDYAVRRNAAIEAVTIEDTARIVSRLLGDMRLLVAIAGRPIGLVP